MQRCDIVIPVFNGLELTRDCLESIESRTKRGYGLMLIDNASSKETSDFLYLYKKSHPDVCLIRNQENIGWVKAINQGIAASRAPFVCVMNNDTVVRTENWLDILIDIAQSEDDIGLVNPYFEAKSREFRDSSYVEIDFCRGYCMLIKREVIEKIGIFDESYGLGYYDDDDYSVRAIRAGFRCVRANAAHVEHLGDSSFKRSFREDVRMALHEKNKKLFYSRWGRRLKVLVIHDGRAKSDLLSEILFDMARRQHVIFLRSSKDPLRIRHTNVREEVISPIFFWPFLIAEIGMNRLKKKDKRYDLAVVEKDAAVVYDILGMPTLRADFRDKEKILRELDRYAKA